jgi:opacity protein-like surface antigen
MIRIETTFITAAVAAAVCAMSSAAAAAAPPGGWDDVPPLSEAKCDYHVKKRYPLEQVLRHGLKVKVTCDGPATVDILVGFANRRQNDWIDLHPGGVPGISTGPPAVLSAAGSVTLTTELIPKRFMRRYARTGLEVILGKERLDRPGVFRGIAEKHTVVVR